MAPSCALSPRFFLESLSSFSLMAVPPVPRIVTARDGRDYDIAPAILAMETLDIDPRDGGNFAHFCTGRSSHKPCLETGSFVAATVLVVWRNTGWDSGITEEGVPVKATTLCAGCCYRWEYAMCDNNRFIRVHKESLQSSLPSSSSVDPRST